MSYRYAEHAGEVELELEAESERGIFESALAAFAELEGGQAGGRSVSRGIQLAAEDRALLLADWLDELVFLAEVEEVVPERVDSFALTGDRLDATVSGRRGRPRHLVKAVTLNRLAFEGRGGGWHARVVLDV